MVPAIGSGSTLAQNAFDAVDSRMCSNPPAAAAIALVGWLNFWAQVMSHTWGEGELGGALPRCLETTVAAATAPAPTTGPDRAAPPSSFGEPSSGAVGALRVHNPLARALTRAVLLPHWSRHRSRCVRALRRGRHRACIRDSSDHDSSIHAWAGAARHRR